MAGIFGKLFNHLVQDVAVTKLANNPAFQRLAVKTVDTVEAAQKRLESAADDPHGTRKLIQENAASFWAEFKEHVRKDLAARDGAPPAPPPSRKR